MLRKVVSASSYTALSGVLVACTPASVFVQPSVGRVPPLGPWEADQKKKVSGQQLQLESLQEHLGLELGLGDCH